MESSQGILPNTPPRAYQGWNSGWGNTPASPVRPYGLVTPVASPERSRSQLAPLVLSEGVGLLYQNALPSISEWRPDPAGGGFNGADISAVHIPHDPSWMVPPPPPLPPGDESIPSTSSGARRAIDLQVLADAALNPCSASPIQPADEAPSGDNPDCGSSSSQEDGRETADAPPSGNADRRFRRKRVQGEAPPSLVTRRQTATLERKRRSKTCCIFYEASGCVHDVVGKLSEGRDQFSSVILRISHFPGEDGEGTWVVFFVKEAIPAGPWEFIRVLTDGIRFHINPPIDKTKSLVTSFGGVVQNFPFVTEQLLRKNAIECHMLPQVCLIPSVLLFSLAVA